MLVFGYAKEYMYSGSGNLLIKVRIPNIHGPMDRREYDGKSVKIYVDDDDLPWYQSVLLPYLPNNGDVVVLTSVNNAQTEWFVVGLTGATWTLADVNR